jgi:hypothetical protein
MSAGQKYDNPREAINHNKPRTEIKLILTPPADNHTHGEPDLNQLFINSVP